MKRLRRCVVVMLAGLLCAWQKHSTWAHARTYWDAGLLEGGCFVCWMITGPLCFAYLVVGVIPAWWVVPAVIGAIAAPMIICEASGIIVRRLAPGYRAIADIYVRASSIADDLAKDEAAEAAVDGIAEGLAWADIRASEAALEAHQ